MIGPLKNTILFRHDRDREWFLVRMVKGSVGRYSNSQPGTKLREHSQRAGGFYSVFESFEDNAA